jgi:hypothetical protein
MRWLRWSDKNVCRFEYMKDTCSDVPISESALVVGTPRYSHGRFRTHAHTLTNTHTITHTYKHTHNHMHKRQRNDTCSEVPITESALVVGTPRWCKDSEARNSRIEDLYVCMYMYVCMHANTHTEHWYMHKYIHTLIAARWSNTNKHTHAEKQTDRQTHIHTHMFFIP